MNLISKPIWISKRCFAILAILYFVRLCLAITECEAQSFPERCFIDHERQLVFKVPAIKNGSWFHNGKPLGAITLTAGSTHSLDFSLNLSASDTSNIDLEVANYARESEIYLGVYKFNGIQKWKVGSVDALTKDYSFDGHRIIEHRLFFRDKTVSIMLGCKEEKFEKNQGLLNRIKESIRPFDPEFQSKLGKTTGKKSMSFFDKQLGIQLGGLPQISAEQNVSIFAFSVFQSNMFTTIVKAEITDKENDIKNRFLEQGDGPPLLNEETFSDGNIDWKSKDAVVTNPEDASIKHCARIQAAFNDTETILCANVLDIPEVDLARNYSGIPPWENMGGSSPLAKLSKEE